jgi:drug/metabolite transporter (DMT)-like permease
MMVDVQVHDRKAILALAAAGTLWGLTVALSKLALGWLGPAWLSFARFAAAAPRTQRERLCAHAGRHRAHRPVRRGRRHAGG